MSEQVVLWTVTLIKLIEINTNFQYNFDNFYPNKFLPVLQILQDSYL